jgi:hypothetical protein
VEGFEASWVEGGHVGVVGRRFGNVTG